MGHLINPTSLRLSINKRHNFEWHSSTKTDYSYLVNQDQLIYFFFKEFFDNNVFINNGIYFSHIKLFRNLNQRLRIIVYIYDGVFIKSSMALSDKIRKRWMGVMKIFRYSKQIRDEKTQHQIAEAKEYMGIIFKHTYKHYKSFIFIKSLLTIFLNKILAKNNNIEINFKFYKELNEISPQIISFFIRQKLMQRHNLFNVLKDLNKFIQNIMYTKPKNFITFNPYVKNRIIGYKIACSGRFSRKQRASYEWKSANLGRVSLSTLNSFIDYSFNDVRLKYGLCGVKVWLTYTDASTKPKLLNSF